MHAWWSLKQSKFGHSVWLDAMGSKVPCTLITRERSIPNCIKWDDLVYLGEVVRCIQPNEYARQASVNELAWLKKRLGWLLNQNMLWKPEHNAYGLS